MIKRDLLRIETLSKKYNEANMPQYLSYPTSNWWKTSVDVDAFVRDNRGRPVPYLYFHFPYCQKPCYYCMCYRQIASSESEIGLYLQCLEKEFLEKVERFGAETFDTISHLHWGGGTPTLLTCRQIEEMYRVISRNVRIDPGATVSIEAYPDDSVVTLEKLKLLRDLGFKQISFGVQDFDGRIQEAINRDCRKEVVARLVDHARDLGFRVHIDLCYGLPFQGQNELERTIRDVLLMSPDRVELLVYVHYPAIFPLQRKIPSSSIPNSFVRVLLSMLAEELFCDAGYVKVGYDHFVKTDDVLCEALHNKRLIRDFMGYSIEQKKVFLGFGVSAISGLGGGYYHNIMDLSDYLRVVGDGGIPLETAKCHLFGGDDDMRNGIIQKDILTDFAIDKAATSGRWGIDFDRYFEAEIGKLSLFGKDGIVDPGDPDTIRLTPLGRHFARHVAYAFDKYYNHADRR